MTVSKVTAFERVREALASTVERIQDRGSREVHAQCPVHDDSNPSMSVKGVEGQVLVYCHAGCDSADIVSALGLRMQDLYDHPKGAEYRYPDGRVVHRSPSKKFRQSGVTKREDGARAALYRADQAEKAVTAGRRVVVVEGEKDVHAVESLGEVATCSPMGAGRAHKADWSPLKGADVLVVADNDDSGEKHAHQVIVELDPFTQTVCLVQAAEGKDAADHIAAGYGVEDFQALPMQTSSAVEEDSADSDEDGGGNAATMLVNLAEELYDFGVSTTGAVYGIPRKGPQVVTMLKGGKKSLRALLGREFWKRYRKTASSSALADAMLVLEGLAQEQDETALHQRVAEAEGAFWLDIGDDTGRAVRLSGDGWRVEDQAPVRFRRTQLNSELPVPVSGGDIAELWQWLNVSPEDRPMVLAWLVAAFLPGFPHPALSLLGEQGTGKTTAMKVLVYLVDPSPVPARKPPKDADVWVTAAQSSWVVGLDNLSGMPDWLSDSLCRAVTGDGDVRRQLYTDGDAVPFSFRRALVLNGIDLGELRGDLAERLLSVNLEVIPNEQRLEESDFWPLWEDVHPKLLGALLDLASLVLALMPTIRLESKPRMADYARVLAAVDQACGTDGFTRYMGLQSRLAADGLAGSPFYVSMSEHLPAEGFKGTASDLLTLLENAEKGDDTFWRAPKGWPTSKRHVGGVLKRLAPQMRKIGWDVADSYDGAKKVAIWSLTPPK